MRILLSTVLLLVVTVQKPIAIPRNLAWNRSVADIIQVEDGMKATQTFLIENEHRLKPQIYNVEALEGLHKSIDASKELTKNLEKLKREIEKDQGN